MNHKRLSNGIFLFVIAFVIFFLDRNGLGIASFFLGIPAFAVSLVLIVGSFTTKFLGKTESRPVSNKIKISVTVILFAIVATLFWYIFIHLGLLSSRF